MTAKPLVPVALGFAVGLLLGELFQPPLPWLFGASLLFILPALRFQAVRPYLLWPALIFSAWAIHNTQIAVLSPCDIRTLAAASSGQPVLATIRGRLAQTPMPRATERNGATLPRTRARVELSSIRLRHGAWMQADGTVLVSGPGLLPPEYYATREVEITGALAPPPEAPAPGLFNYRAYLRRQGVFFLLQTASPGDWSLTDRRTDGPPWADRFLHWGQAVLCYGLPETDDALDLLRGMTLGSTAGLTAEDFDPFIRSGTMHIFAISGLHIVLISAMLWQLLRVLRFSRRGCGIITLPLIWFYTAATGWQPSAIRATIMMSVIIGGWTLARPSGMLNSLAAAALLILAFDPHQLFGASFQLSFFVVLSLALLMPHFQTRIGNWLEYDPLFPPELATRAQRWTRGLARMVLLSLAVSVAAWLGALPLTALYFNLLGPVTLLANLVIVPLSNIALAANLASLLGGGWFPFLTETFNNCAWGVMSLIIWLSRQAIALPASHWYVPAPSLPDCALYYALLAAACGFYRDEKRRSYAWAAAGLAILLVAGEWALAARRTQITVLPVESGAACFVRDGPGRSTLLVDTGTSNAVQYLVKPFLRAQGCNRLDGLLLTHGDLQHVGGTRLVDQFFPVGHIYASPLRFRSPVYRQLLSHYDEVPGKVQRLAREQHLGHWHILHPGPQTRPARADDASLVLWGTFAPRAPTILLLPDLGNAGQKSLLECYPGLRADILIAGLTSGEEPLRPEFLAAVRPRLVVLQDPEYPHYERPTPALIQRLRQLRVPVIRTSEQGAATLRLKGDAWHLRTMRGFQTTIVPLPSPPTQTVQVTPDPCPLVHGVTNR